MSIFKRGNVYWYHFVFNGDHVQESTKQGNPNVARNIEAAHRTALAKGEVGFREKRPAITLAEFIEKRFEPWAKATFEKSSPKTWTGWYRTNLRALAAYLRTLSTGRKTLWCYLMWYLTMAAFHWMGERLMASVPPARMRCACPSAMRSRAFDNACKPEAQLRCTV